MAEKKDKMMEEYLSSPLKAGDQVMIDEKNLNVPYGKEGKRVYCSVKSTDGDSVTVEYDDYGKKKECVVNSDTLTKETRYIGVNPFRDDDWRRLTRTVNYGIGSIISCIYPELHKNEIWEINGIPIKETNFNPYVIDADGKKRYYQRPLVWTLKEKQTLIESIYNGLNCGQILVRNRNTDDVELAMKSGDTEICCRDVVDGKQRLNALYEFMTDKWPDMNGNYFSDFSHISQAKFRSSQAFTFAEMDVETTDRDVIAAFLNVNYTGVPQSMDHIEYVKEIAGLMK